MLPEINESWTTPAWTRRHRTNVSHLKLYQQAQQAIQQALRELESTVLLMVGDFKGECYRAIASLNIYYVRLSYLQGSSTADLSQDSLADQPAFIPYNSINPLLERVDQKKQILAYRRYQKYFEQYQDKKQELFYCFMEIGSHQQEMHQEQAPLKKISRRMSQLYQEIDSYSYLLSRQEDLLKHAWS